MSDKTRDDWGELPIKRGEFQAERIVRRLMNAELNPSDLHVVSISERGKELSNGAKMISVITPPPVSLTEELGQEKADAFRQRLELEAQRLLQPVKPTQKIRPANTIIQVVKDPAKE